MFRKVLVAVLMMCVACGTAVADVPQLLNYQGRLDDAGGNPVTGTVSLGFGFYDAKVAGNPLYYEEQAVTVTNGVFHVLIGSATLDGVPIAVFDGPTVYLSVTVDGEELTPRQQIASVGFAFKAADAEHAATAADATAAADANLLDGQDSTVFASAATTTKGPTHQLAMSTTATTRPRTTPTTTATTPKPT